jgi:hypothetical protein
MLEYKLLKVEEAQQEVSTQELEIQTLALVGIMLVIHWQQE